MSIPFLIAALGLLLPIHQSQLFVFALGPETRGRIVLYDWFSHELTVSEDFVIETTDHQFLRVIYFPLSAEQPGNNKLRLDRSAFVGRGRFWKFKLQAPATDQEKLYCGHPAPDVEVEDEKGHDRIPAYVRSPGSDNLKIPSVVSLPCYVLPVDGMQPENGASLAH